MITSAWIGRLIAAVLVTAHSGAGGAVQAQPLDRPMRAIHLSGKWGANRYHAVEQWDPDGTEPLIPRDFAEAPPTAVMSVSVVQITPIRRASSRQFSNCPGNRDHFIGESFVQSTVQPVSQTATALLAGIVLAVAVPVAAQPLTSRVEGTVQDETGAVIPGASVTMTRVDTGVAQETAADERGLYLFPLVPAGTYTMQAGAAGFTTTVIEGVRVALNAPTSIDVVLEVGAVSETVVVAAAGPQSLLNTANAELSTNLSREQVRDLPLNGRGVTQLVLTQAGVTSPSGTRDASISGTRGTFNNFTLDGVNNQDSFIRTDALFGEIPVKESFIEEIGITTGNADVDDGLGASQTHFVTRSGGNTFATEVFLYHRNEAFNATNFFNKAAGLEKERLREHEYGFNVGGPIVRNRAFFFFNYEEERVPGSSSVVRTVLTDPARRGDFSYVRQDTGQLATVNLFNLSGLAPDPAMRSLVASTPGPNDASVGDGRNTAGYRFNAPRQLRRPVAGVSRRLRGEPAALAEGDVSSVHPGRTPNSVGNGIGSVFPGRPGAGQGSWRMLGSFGVTSSLGQSAVNEAHFGYQGTSVWFANNETFADGHRLSLSGFSNPVRNFLDQGRDDLTLELGNNLTWVNGAHTLKVGGSVRWNRVNAYNDAGLVPTYYLGFGVGNPDPLLPALFPGGISSDELDTASDAAGLARRSPWTKSRRRSTSSRERPGSWTARRSGAF